MDCFGFGLGAMLNMTNLSNHNQALHLIAKPAAPTFALSSAAIELERYLCDISIALFFISFLRKR